MIFSPSGGLVYHWRAWRNGKTWSEFRHALAEWLRSWPCPREELVLIGPSAGYTLPTDWLRGFESVTAYDLDPLAPLLFRSRHRGVRTRFIGRDLFWVQGKLSTAPLRGVLEAHPRATILFSNVLGQVLLEGTATEREWEDFLHELRASLKGRAWASYHDLFTHEGGEIIDHLMQGRWKEGLAVQEFLWPLSSRSVHRIEGVRPL